MTTCVDTEVVVGAINKIIKCFLDDGESEDAKSYELMVSEIINSEHSHDTAERVKKLWRSQDTYPRGYLFDFSDTTVKELAHLLIYFNIDLDEFGKSFDPTGKDKQAIEYIKEHELVF